MRNFRDILRLAFRHRWMLTGILVSSMVAAFLWGANLGSIYPIVDVVLQRQSMRDWVRHRIDQSQQECVRLEQLISAVAGDHLDDDLEVLQDRLEAEQRRLRWSQWLQPWIERYTPATPFATLQLVALALLLGTLIKSIFLVMNAILVEYVTQHVALHLRSQLFEKMLYADMSFYARHRPSQLLSHLTHDVECIVVGIRTVLGRAILEPLKIVACLAGAAFVCWQLLLLSLLVTPLAILAINRVASLVKRANHRALQEMAGIYDRLSEAIHGILLIKAADQEQFEQRRFFARGTDYRRRMGKIASIAALTKPGNEIMSISVICLALLAGGYLVLNRETSLFGIPMCDRPLDFASLMTFFALLAGVSDPFRKLVDVYGQIQQAAAAAERLQELTVTHTELPQPARPLRLTSPLREIELHDVSFAYQRDHWVLQHVDLRIHAGETLAIVGPNGCGKSTLLSLLLRLYDPVQGSILWNGTNLRDVLVGDLRSRIGMVTQQAFLFDESIEDNIRYGCPDATLDQVIAAARIAHADEFIQHQLTDQYQTIVGAGGKNLSGGQRQRIALARAVLRDPELLLLDEATSQIDAESQRLIHETLRDFCRERTTILVTHRPETISLADRILVMEAGQIVDIGTEQELLHRCHVYQRLWRQDMEINLQRASA